MSKRTISDILPEDYLLGVWPVSLQSQRDYNTPFHLYFEKSLQIISRHVTPSSNLHKDDPLKFAFPDKIQSFRVQSDKNMDYQWNLYIKRNDVPANNEQFIETQSIDLKPEWLEFKNSSKNCCSRTVRFQKMKMDFIFLIAIDRTNQRLLKTARKFMQDPQAVRKLSDESLNPTSPITHRRNSLIMNIEDFKDPKEMTKLSSLQTFTDYDGSETPTFLLPVQDARKQLSLRMPSPKFMSIAENDEVNEKMSTSDIAIGNDIEEKIHLSETGDHKQKETSAMLIQNEEEASHKSDAVIQLTSSQLLNDKGEPYVPIYEKRSSILFIIVVFMFIMGLALFAFQLNQAPAVNSVKDKKKVSRQKEGKERREERRRRRAKG